MMSNVYTFKATQKFRVVIDSVCFYSNAKQIRNGVGDFTNCNIAVLQALEAFEKLRSSDDITSSASGLAGTWNGMNIQLNIV
jgi:hypothetical protein